MLQADKIMDDQDQRSQGGATGEALAVLYQVCHTAPPPRQTGT